MVSRCRGSDYKLRVGAFLQNGTLHFTSAMVNPYTYIQFLVKEFFEDPDSNAVSVIAGAELVSPFEQKLDQFCSLLSDITLYPTRFILSERELVLL